MDALDTEIAALETQIRASQIQLDYLTALTRGGQDGVSSPADAGDLVALLAALGQETGRAGRALQEAQADLRGLMEERREAQSALEDARAALDALTPYPDDVAALTVDVETAADTELAIEVTYLTDAASWRPDYEMTLDTEDAQVALARTIVVEQTGPELWAGIDLTVSTADPDRPRAPSVVEPRPARIAPPRPVQIGAGAGANAVMQFGSGNLGQITRLEDAPAPVAVARDTRASAEFRGMSLSYVYPRPVTLVPGEAARLLLDEVTFDAEVEIRAVPREDDFAFLVAAIVNDSGEPILPGGVRFVRDGDFLGTGSIRLIPAGARQELFFGPVDGLPLEWRVVSLEQGDTGVMARLQTRTNRIVFTVENTTAEPQSLTALYAVPFSEQEDLELRLEMRPAPSRRAVDDERGVHAWDLALDPGEQAEVTIIVSLGWPEDQVLEWEP